MPEQGCCGISALSSGDLTALLVNRVGVRPEIAAEAGTDPDQ